MQEKRSVDTAKRETLKKAAYAVPAMLTLAAAPSFASAGSSSKNGKRKLKGGLKGRTKRSISVSRSWRSRR